MMKRFSTYFETLDKQDRKVRFSLVLAAFAVLLFIVVALTAPLTNEFLSELFPKDASEAAGAIIAIEGESTALSGDIQSGNDENASGNQYIQFGIDTTPASYMPSPPYYATFYYMWYKAPNPDGSWSYWPDHGKNPPNTWFSHFLPDPIPSVFDPANELYSANNYTNFKWQLTKLAEARQEVAIASWWGPGTKEDISFNNIINDFMKRADNPYPNLRWTVYYEDEGFGDPSVSTIVADLNHLKSRYMTSPYFLKVNGKPVVFVYAGGTDSGAMAKRWKDANTQLGNAFYVVLKLYSGYASDPNQPDSWHQYAPAVRSGSHAPHSFFVSPGFWLDDNASAERLPRNAGEFETAVKQMVASSATWKLTETWNEWGEGTSVEPGEQVKLNSSTGKDEPDPNGYPFKNLYVDILMRNLPPLEHGTGTNGTVAD